MIIFAIVFGLSMDYEVFLISRIREHWLAGQNNQTSVANGLSETARVITCAAVILASVFFAFLLSTSVTVKMLALGLGASVLIDATIIRLIIDPALMFLFDKSDPVDPPLAWIASCPASTPSSPHRPPNRVPTDRRSMTTTGTPSRAPRDPDRYPRKPRTPDQATASSRRALL
jgi:putative drug exporter of the RND superfamily